jgi:molybdopterin-guanine dinucleotide biosynthesis protein
VRTTTLLERAVKALSAQGGAAGVVAHSVEIRLRTFARLSATAGRQG